MSRRKWPRGGGDFAEEMAVRAKTIVDQVFVSIANRVPRIVQKNRASLLEGNR